MGRCSGSVDGWRTGPPNARTASIGGYAGGEFAPAVAAAFGVAAELDDVRPSARRRGHATAMLAAALPVAQALGIDAALVTCDVDNVASRRVIELNGGERDDQRAGKLRFWIST